MQQHFSLSAFMLIVSAWAFRAEASIHVSTTGSDANAGTADAPLLTIHKAVELVEPGDTIWVHAGTYTISERIKIPEKKTSEARRCYLWAVPGEGEVIIDGSGMHHTTQNDFKMGRCIYVNHLANYWYFKGLTLCNAEDNGMKVEGSYNIIENCIFRDNNDTGLQIGMYKDFSIEETKELPAGSPQFNPDYRYCRGNIVLNCDAYNNYDARTYNGTDDGGDADGFACKLFPGPGTEFYGCRAWNNSDDNWDLYMVYHPVVIDHCWAYHAGYIPGTETAIGNGNGFKLGGGGSAGGAAFDQSTGAHVVRNCVSFDNLKKGFDQNNAYEGMYILNCTAWGNDYNYRFPTVFRYGGMHIRNCIGFKPRTLNHEFLSADKEGSLVPDTDFNTWTTLDGCNPYKEGQKNDDGKKTFTADYTSEFLSLSVEDFLAPRQADGSLPDNNFARLKEGSVMIDKGEPIVNFIPSRFMTAEEALAAGLTLDEADIFTIAYNDDAPDFGAYETDGIPATGDVTPIEKATLSCVSGNASQEMILGEPIEQMVFEYGGSATGFEVENLPEGLQGQITDNRLVIDGEIAAVGDYSFTVKAVGGPKTVSCLCSVSVLTPSRILTGGWYHLQDELSDLPADLQGVLSLIQGSSSSYPSSLDPAKTESGTVPAGCTEGAIIMGRNSGGVQWTFPNGVLSLLVNLHFTGGRTFGIEWTLADGTTGSTSTSKISKGTYTSWNVLAQAGLPEQLAGPFTIRLLNTNSSGEVRLYDMYMRVPLAEGGETHISDVVREETGSKQYYDFFGRRVQHPVPGRLYIVK
ncbi:MAG: right-handed parallel beta-helix repeat-containing protein [Bacteroidales bacterium]|nr:right-handed parallel beta-helix repeat-containing protein [Bacteroidales bacterium]